MKIVPEISLSLTLNSVTQDQTWNLGSSPETSATLNTSFPAEIVYSPSVLTYQSAYPDSLTELNTDILYVTVKGSDVYQETTVAFHIPTIIWDVVYGRNRVSKNSILNSSILNASRLDHIVNTNYYIEDQNCFTYSISDGYVFSSVGSVPLSTTFKKSGYVSFTTLVNLIVYDSSVPQPPAGQPPLIRRLLV